MFIGEQCQLQKSKMNIVVNVLVCAVLLLSFLFSENIWGGFAIKIALITEQFPGFHTVQKIIWNFVTSSATVHGRLAEIRLIFLAQCRVQAVPKRIFFCSSSDHDIFQRNACFWSFLRDSVTKFFTTVLSWFYNQFSHMVSISQWYSNAQKKSSVS